MAAKMVTNNKKTWLCNNTFNGVNFPIYIYRFDKKN